MINFNSLEGQVPVPFSEVITFFPDLIREKNKRHHDYEQVYDVVSIEIAASNGSLSRACCTLNVKNKKELDDFDQERVTTEINKHKLEQLLKEAIQNGIKGMLNAETIVDVAELKWTSKTIMFREGRPTEDPNIISAMFACKPSMKVVEKNVA